MEEHPGLSDQFRKTSAWPMFVAFGFVISEVGILFGLVPVAVGGLLLFVGSIAGIVQESGYVERPWNLLVGLGVALCAIGVALTLTQTASLSGDLLGTLTANGIVLRGVSIVLAGIIAGIGGGVGRAMERETI
jgi:hypothetical protein